MNDNISILKNYLLYFLLMILVCMVGISGVFADTLENIGYLDENSEVLVEVSYTGNPLPLQRLGEYQLGQVEAMNINVSNFTFNAGTTYSLEFFTSKTPLTYANAFTVVGNGSNNQSVTCSTVGITYDDIKYLNFRFNCPSTVNYINLRIFNSSNNYIMDTGLFTWGYVYLRKVTSSTDTSILESQNAQIIQGQQDIINNQNSNTDKQIESQKVCKTYDYTNIPIKETDSALDVNGNIVSANNFAVSDYVKLNTNETYILTKESWGAARSYCLYNENKTIKSCYTYGAETSFTITNANYIRYTISLTSNRTVVFKGKYCENGNQALNDSITGLDDTLNNSDIDNSDALDFFNNFSDNTHGLSGIISAPLTAINAMLSDQCSPLTATWRNQTISLPCGYEMWGRFSSFKSFLNVAIDGLLCYRILIKLFKLVEKFKNPNDDRVEVMDL